MASRFSKSSSPFWDFQFPFYFQFQIHFHTINKERFIHSFNTMNANTTVDPAKDDGPNAIENIATAASTRKQKMMFKKLVMRRKTMLVQNKKINKKTLNKSIERPPPTDIDENPRSLFSNFFQDKENRKENVNYTDSVSCRSRLRTALDETTTHKRSICIFEEEDDDIYQKYSTSTVSTSESDMSVRTGDDWTSYYRERRLQRRKQQPSLKKLLRRRRFATSGTSITSAPARMMPSRIDEMGFATFV